MKVIHQREDVGKRFRFFNCWVVLRNFPKFDHPNSSGTTTTEGSDKDDEGDGLVTESSTISEQAERNKIADESCNKRRNKKTPVGRQTAKVQAAAEDIFVKKEKLCETAQPLQQVCEGNLSPNRDAVVYRWSQRRQLREGQRVL